MAARRVPILWGVMGLDFLVGRDKERRALDELIRKRRNVLLMGDEGVGKSALLEDALANSELENILYSTRSTTLRETLLNFLQCATDIRDLSKKNILKLKKYCYELLEPRPDYVVLDHIGWVEPKFYSFLIFIKEQNIPLIIAARETGRKNLGHLWMGLYDFAVLDVQNLDQAGTGALVNHYASKCGLRLASEETFKKDIFKISRGNPKIIRDLCQLAGNEKYRFKGCIDLKLMELDRRISLAMDRIDLD